VRPGSREMERGRWEGQNFQPLKEVQRLEEEESTFAWHLPEECHKSGQNMYMQEGYYVYNIRHF